MTSKTQKATFALDRWVLQALAEAVAAGAAPSKNALVEQALRARLKLLRYEIEQSRWQQAANDPVFMNDLKEIDAEFAGADAEASRLTE